jgi:hypothetical protein
MSVQTQEQRPSVASMNGIRSSRSITESGPIPLPSNGCCRRMESRWGFAERSAGILLSTLIRTCDLLDR